MVKDTIKEETQEKKKKLPKEISQEILKKMFGNLLRAVGIMLYFIVLNLAYTTMKPERLIGDIEVFAGAFLVAGIIFLEKAYKKDDGTMGITGVELLFLALHSLSIMHVITMFRYDFRFYLLTSSYVFSIYYVLKSIVLYTKGRKEYLKSLSDISEIVKKEEPVKKEAKKREEPKEEEKTEREEKQTEMKKTKEKAKTLKTTTKKKTIKNEKTKNEKDKEDKKEKVSEKSNKKKSVKKEDKKKTTKKEASKPVEKKTEKEEQEVKTPEKKKRGRPKKEVVKND